MRGRNAFLCPEQSIWWIHAATNIMAILGQAGRNTHSKVKNHSTTCISGAALPWEMLCLFFQPRSCLCHLNTPSKCRFALNLLAGDNLDNGYLLYLQPLSWSANRTIFATFDVSVGFAGCYPRVWGSY